MYRRFRGTCCSVLRMDDDDDDDGDDDDNGSANSQAQNLTTLSHTLQPDGVVERLPDC